MLRCTRLDLVGSIFQHGLIPGGTEDRDYRRHVFLQAGVPGNGTFDRVSGSDCFIHVDGVVLRNLRVRLRLTVSGSIISAHTIPFMAIIKIIRANPRASVCHLRHPEHESCN
jgi:hypothetical protein